MILRIFLCALLAIAAVMLPTPLFALAAFAYALRYTAYELIFITAGIDALYGGGSFIPYYTIFATLGLLAVEWIKPRLSVYN